MDDNSEATYAEVGVIHKEKFDVAESNCYARYATVDSLSVTRLSKEDAIPVEKASNRKLIIIVIFICMTILILGTVSACIVFALKINKLKSDTASLIKDSSLNVQELNTSFHSMLKDFSINQETLQLLHQQLSQNHSLINNRIQQLNNTFHSEFNTKVQNLKTFIDISYQRVNQHYSELENNTKKLFDISGNLVQHTSLTISSCAALPRSFPSGYYWVGNSIDSAKHVYCNVSEPCGGVSGWTKVAELDMTNSSHHCPSGLVQRTYSNKRTCVRGSDYDGCSSVTFSSNAVRYNKVCGRVIAYQYGSPDGFLGAQNNIDSIYVDGVALTHGNPRQHMWTFAADYDELPHSYRCPCTYDDQTTSFMTIPSFVGNDYFCDTGSENNVTRRFYGDDPLWDGAGCGPHNRCCTFNNPPWFYKQLPQPTTDDIEMRVCRDYTNTYEDIAIEIIEIYIQ